MSLKKQDLKNLNESLYIILLFRINLSQNINISISGDVGGYMGLLLGASVLTICEIIDLFLYNAFRKFLHSEKEKEKPMTELASINSYRL